MDNVLHLLGIARKAGRVEVGEEPVGASARARQARLILVASDAADNSARRAAHFAQAGKAPWFRVPYTKGELGGTVGRASCAMLALTDVTGAASCSPCPGRGWRPPCWPGWPPERRRPTARRRRS